jgi:hypothetical protein
MNYNETISNIVAILIREYGVKIDKNVGCFGYDDVIGAENIFNFKVKGAKNWTFGIWHYSNIENRNFVAMFCENDDYIVKFKPSGVVSCNKLEHAGSHELSDSDELASFAYTINAIAAHPLLMRYVLYTTQTCSIVKFFIEEFWFFRIRKPIEKLFKKLTKKQ